MAFSLNDRSRQALPAFGASFISSLGDVIGRKGRGGQVELESRHGHHQFGPFAVLEQRVFDGRGAADKQSTTKAALVLRDPVAAAVLADQEESSVRTAREKCLTLAHGYLR